MSNETLALIVFIAGILYLGCVAISGMVNNFRLVDNNYKLKSDFEGFKKSLKTKQYRIDALNARIKYLQAVILRLEGMIKSEEKTCEYCEHWVDNSGGACESLPDETCEHFKIEVSE